MKAIFLIPFILLITFLTAYGDEKPPDEVLIGNELRDIAMDEDYVWVATEKGVNRYDRKSDEWKFFTISDGLISNQVNCVAPELVEGLLGRKSGDEVWFGTDSGVSVYYKKTGEWKSFTTKDGLIHNRVNVISARGNDVWIGTDKGASMYDKKKRLWMSYSNFPGIPTTKVTAIYHQHDYAWIGTEEGLVRYNYKLKKWEYFRTTGSLWYNNQSGVRTAEDFPLLDNHINTIDGEGRYVYIATNSSLVVFDSMTAHDMTSEQRGYSGLGRGKRVQNSTRYRTQRSGDSLSMSADREKLWKDLGWTHLNIVSLSADKSHEVSSAFFDVAYRSGQTWIATNRGLIRLDFLTTERQIFRKEQGLIDDEITTVATTGGEVWAGTPHGLSRYNTYRRSWTNYRMEQALPSAYVTALAEDKDGMWFATQGAVSSYKNERWKTFTRNEGLAGNNIKSIAVVGNFVWFGTDEGISRLNKSTLQWDNFKTKSTGLVSNNITSVLVDGKFVWIGTKDGLSRYDDTTEEWKDYTTKTGLLDNQITSIIADPEFVWVGTKSGLNRYNKKSDDWISFEKYAITSLALDGDNVLVGTNKGLSAIDRKTGEWKDYIDKPITAVSVQSDSQIIWLGGRRNISWYKPVTGEIHTFTDADVDGISRVNVYGIQNTTKYVWFATDGGIFRYSKSDGTWWTYSPSRQRGSMDTLADGNVRSVVADEDFVYFGTAGGISRYDKMTGNWLNYTTTDGLIDNDVYALMLDRADLWVGTQKGINRYDTVSDLWIGYTKKDGLASDMIYSLAISKSPKKIIWAGTRGGVAYFEDDKWKRITVANGLPDNNVWSVDTDSNSKDEVWFGTNKGAVRYNYVKDTYIVYTVEDGLTDNVILSIGFTGKYVFLNTPKGATIYDSELDTFTPFSRPEGLVGASVKCADSEHEKVWIGTENGVTLYDFVTDRTKSFNENDGLAGNNTQSIKVDGKDVWFATDSGVSRYDSVSDQWVTYRKISMVSQSSGSADLISPNIKSLAGDDNYVWVGTRIGLSRYDKLSSLWDKFPLSGDISSGNEASLDSPLAGLMPDLPRTTSPFIRTMAVTGKYLWMGSDDGLFIYDSSKKSLTGFISRIEEDIILKNIRNIIVDKSKIWIMCDDLIALFERTSNSNSWTFISDNRIVEKSIWLSAEIDTTTSQRMIKISEKRIDFDKGIGLINLTAAGVSGDLVWFGRTKGLSIYDTKKQKLVTSINIPDDLSQKIITAIAFDKGSSWIGTREGLYHYDFNTKTWDKMTTENGLASDRVSSLVVDDKNVWVGSSDRGISCYDKETSKWQVFKDEDGLADNNVRTILVDGDRIWFGTFSGGVCRYDKASDLWTTYRSADYKTASYVSQ